MAIKMQGTKKPEPTLEDLYDTASASVAAETLLTAMRPKLEHSIKMRIRALFEAPAELGPMLNARAELKAIWDLQQGLENESKKGRPAVEIMNNLLLKSAANS